MTITLGFILKPLCISISRIHTKIHIIQKTIHSHSFPSFSSLTSSQIQSFSITCYSNSNQNHTYPLSLLNKEDEEQDFEFEFEEHDSNDEEDDVGFENGEEGSPVNLGMEVVEGNTKVKNVNLPNPTGKENKELTSYAHG
ncbi:hypothetical protein GQ457_14G002860 [Hibiscus cannabinus]